MAPSEHELLQVRLARMKALILELELTCAENENNHEKFTALKAELDAARLGLKTLETSDLTDI